MTQAALKNRDSSLLTCPPLSPRSQWEAFFLVSVENFSRHLFVGVRAPSCGIVAECSTRHEWGLGLCYSSPAKMLVEIISSSSLPPARASPHLDHKDTCVLCLQSSRGVTFCLILGTAPRTGHLGDSLDRWGVVNQRDRGLGQ